MAVFGAEVTSTSASAGTVSPGTADGPAGNGNGPGAVRGQTRSPTQRPAAVLRAHAARHAIEGDFKGAATEVLSAVAAPAVLAGVAVAELVSDVFNGAKDLAEDTLGGAETELAGRAA